MTPIPARCARCDSAFSLFAVVEEGTGTCPRRTRLWSVSTLTRPAS
jgi:hypothetical protein